MLTPAGRSSLYALKLTVGNFAPDGIFRLTKSLDSIGGMAKCSSDLAILTRMLISTAQTDIDTANIGSIDLEAVRAKQFKELAVGFVDPEVWRLPSFLLDPTDEYKKQTVSGNPASFLLLLTL